MLSIIGLVLVALFKGDEDAYQWIVVLGLFELVVDIGICAAVFGG